MISTILKIIPNLDTTQLQKMEASLNSRFNKVAKRFGRGLMGVLKGGGLLGAGLALINKLLNPLKEVQESIERTISRADDVVTYAQNFGTTAGRLFKLETYARATGLNREDLYMLLGRYQGAVADARTSETPHLLDQFKNTEDMAESFFSFIQSLQKADRTTQIKAQEQIFGERQMLRAAEFLNTDFNDLSRKLGPLDAAAMDRSLNRGANLSDLNDRLTSIREWNEMRTRPNIISEGVIRGMDQRERLLMDQENRRIVNFQNIQNLSNGVTKIMTLLEDGFQKVGAFVPRIEGIITKVSDFIDRALQSNWFKGIFRWGKK